MIENIISPTEMSALYFLYRGATSLEHKGWYGLTHFMEHLVCKNFNDLEDALQENGIEWNAWTSENEVVIHFTGLEKYLAPFRDELIERSKTLRATPEDVEKEKKIVLEEYMDCFTDQSEAHQLHFMRQHHGSYTAIGLGEDIAGFTHQDCLDFFALQFQHPDAIINVSNSFQLVRDDLTFVDRLPLLRKDWAADPYAPLEETPGDTGKTSLIYEREADYNDLAILGFLTNLLGGELNSPLYDEIREKRGLVYFLQFYVSPLGSKALIRLYTMTSHENVEEFEAAATQVLANRDANLTPQRVERVRKSLLIQREKGAINRYKSVEDLLIPHTAQLNAILETVTIDELRAAYDKYFDLSTFTRSASID